MKKYKLFKLYQLNKLCVSCFGLTILLLETFRLFLVFCNRCCSECFYMWVYWQNKLGWNSRWWSRRTCGHLLLRELQNYYPLLNNHQQENVGPHQKKIPHVQGQRRSPFLHLVFCGCAFQSVCPLMNKDKRFMEVFWWQRLTEGEKEEDGRRGKTAFRIKPRTRQRHSEGSNKTLCNQERPQRLSQMHLWVSPVQVQAGVACRRGRALGAVNLGVA